MSRIIVTMSIDSMRGFDLHETPDPTSLIESLCAEGDLDIDDFVIEKVEWEKQPIVCKICDRQPTARKYEGKGEADLPWHVSCPHDKGIIDMLVAKATTRKGAISLWNAANAPANIIEVHSGHLGVDFAAERPSPAKSCTNCAIEKRTDAIGRWQAVCLYCRRNPEVGISEYNDNWRAKE